MANKSAIVKDSSIWVDPKQQAAVGRMDGIIRVGIIKSAYNDSDSGELRYLVEVQNHNTKINLNCRLIRRFGGVFNYEDYVYRGYKFNDKPDPVSSFDAKAGDAVLVGQLNGQGREGIIIGGLTHAAHTTAIKASDGPQYDAEFNGVHTSINKDGEWTLTFKGQPTNLNILSATPSGRLPAPTYNTSVGSSFMKFDKEGGWTLNDNAKSDPQFIHVDKKNGIITVTSGKISLKMTKSNESVLLVSKSLTVNAADKITETTKEYSMHATTSVKVNSPKVAIGTDGIELLDQLTQLIDALGKLIPISPVGPCTALSAISLWPKVEDIKSKINQIKGTL